MIIVATPPAGSRLQTPFQLLRSCERTGPTISHILINLPPMIQRWPPKPKTPPRTPSPPPPRLFLTTRQSPNGSDDALAGPHPAYHLLTTSSPPAYHPLTTSSPPAYHLLTTSLPAPMMRLLGRADTATLQSSAVCAAITAHGSFVYSRQQTTKHSTRSIQQHSTPYGVHNRATLSPRRQH